MGARGEEGPPALRPPQPSAQAGSEVFRQYYLENDIFLSSEGILKVLSIMGCLVSSALLVGGGSCGGGAALPASAALTALGAAAAQALLYAGVALGLPLVAPQSWLYADIIVSSAAGVLLLLTGVLSVTICELSGVLDYVHGPLAMLIALMVTGSAFITYSSAMRRWDAAAGPAREPRAPPAHEHDV